MGEIVVKRITKSGFGPAPGQIPSELKLPLMVFDYLNEEAVKTTKTKSKYLKKQLDAIKDKKTNSSFRCAREGFVPFDVLGRLLPSARADGIPPVGSEVVVDKNGNLLQSPLYLVLDKRDEFIAALAVLYTQADGELKLEYLCAAPKFKGAGSNLLELIRSGMIFKTVARGIRRVFLNNNSNKPGFYARKGFLKVGKTKKGQYMKKDSKGKIDKKTGEVRLINKILNIYKASMNSVMPYKVIVNKAVKTPTKPTKPTKPIKTISKPVTRIIQTRRHPLPPPKTPLYKLRKRTILRTI